MKGSKKICLVCSSGGHLLELVRLKDAWRDIDRFWVSFDTEDARSLLKDEKKYWARFPTNRNILNLIRNSFLAFTILKKERPGVIISTGAGVAVPFILAGKMFGARAIFIESIARVDDISLTGRLIYRFVDKFFVQWPDLAEKFKKTEYKGAVI